MKLCCHLEHAVSCHASHCYFHHGILSSSWKRRTDRTSNHHPTHVHGLHSDRWWHVPSLHWAIFGSLFCVLHDPPWPQHYHDRVSSTSSLYPVQFNSYRGSFNGMFEKKVLWKVWILYLIVIYCRCANCVLFARFLLSGFFIAGLVPF